jgi:hypothetical protein
VEDTHILSKLITGIESKKEKSLFNITDVEIGSFGVDEVNKVVTAMLAVDDKERTLGLAEICYRRTLGNLHFFIEFMTMLEEEDLIHFNLGLLNWVWDEKHIHNETMSTANVANLLQARMKKLPEQAQCKADQKDHREVDGKQKPKHKVFSFDSQRGAGCFGKRLQEGRNSVPRDYRIGSTHWSLAPCRPM